MQATLTNWGHSLGVRIPKSLATMLEFEAGTTVELELKDQKIILSKPKEYNLETLVSGITPDNKPGLIDWETNEGREVW